MTETIRNLHFMERRIEAGSILRPPTNVISQVMSVCCINGIWDFVWSKM